MTKEHDPNLKMPQRFENGIRGTARDVERREVSAKGYNSQNDECLSFRLEIVDEQGNVTEIIPVEFRSQNIPGRILKDGDNVILIGQRNRQGLMFPKFIYNATISSEIRVKGFGFGNALLGGFLGIVVTFSAIGFLAGILLSFPEPSTGVPLLVLSTLLLTVCGYIARKRRL